MPSPTPRPSAGCKPIPAPSCSIWRSSLAPTLSGSGRRPVPEAKVAVLCPTRGRPEGLRKMAQSVRATSGADVYAYIDEDWEEEYVGIPEVERFVGPRVGPVRAVNRLVRKVPDYAAYGFLTDDTTVLTAGWDRWVLDAMSS